MNKQSEKFLRKRKALLVLPLLALPFITLAFWAMGGGKGSSTVQAQQKQGINTSLPDAQLSGTSLDKMSLYDQAATDSLKNKGNNDPFGSQDTTVKKANDTSQSAQTTQPVTPSNGGLKTYSDPNEFKVRSKLAQLEQTLNQPVAQGNTLNSDPSNVANTQAADADLNRLQQSMQQVNQDNSPDPQMQQMNGMLEKILDIQHPDRVQQQLREQSLKNRGQVYPVARPEEQTEAALLGGKTLDTPAGLIPVYTIPAGDGNGFYNLEETTDADVMRPAIPAVVQETQTVVSGSAIKLRLTDDIMINGVLVPRNNFVFGLCSVEGERLKISITGIRFNNNLFPVSMSVYDLDALEGIRIPGAIGRDASKEGADRAIQSVQLMSLDQSVGAQAAGVGLEAAKGLFSKKVKLVRVTVKAGYPVLLLDDKAKQRN